MFKKIFKKDESEQDKLDNYIDKFRRKNIPERYNQIKLMNHLFSDEVNHLISISNRSDGKSFNYMHFLLQLSIDYGLGFCFIVRHHTLQYAGQKLLQKIIDVNTHLNYKDFMFMRTEFYIVLIYKDQELGIFTDLNKATDLKYQSNYLQDFPIMVYDEFLALESDYLSDEWDKLKTIYGSINRGIDLPFIKKPKVLYLGNAVNFSSPVLANLNLFNMIENHKLNTMQQYGDIVLEINKNDNANEQRNLEAFREDRDNMTHGEFDVNNHMIATKYDRQKVNIDPAYIYVKLRGDYLKITYNRQTFESILSIVNYSKDYDFNYLLKDNKKTSIFLDDNFYDIEYERKHNKGVFLYANNYSRDYILDGLNNLKELRINTIIKHHYTNNSKDNFERREEVYKNNYIENTKKYLFEKLHQ